MSLDTKIDNLYRERTSAIEYRDKKMKGIPEARARYEGWARAGTVQGGDESPENVEFEFVSYRVSQCVVDNPQVREDSPIFEIADEVMAHEKAMNRWIKDSDLRSTLLEYAVDFSFGWGVLLVSRRPAVELGEVAMKGGTGIPFWPYMTRIPPEQAYKDHLSTSAFHGRFAGHDIVADKDSLLERARDPNRPKSEKWDEDAIEAIADDSGLDALPRQRFVEGPTRKEIVYTQMWVADAEIDWATEALDDQGNPTPPEKRYLYNGRLYYFALCRPNGNSGQSEPREIRASEPYFGPPCGPYVFAGEHIVPNCPYPMSTLSPAHGTIQLLNGVVKTINDAIKQYKKIGLVNDLEEGLADIITNGENGKVYTVAGLDTGMVHALELGGATNQMVAHEELMHNRADRLLAMDDAQRGKADDEASATSVAVAAENAGGRMEYTKKQLMDGVRRALQIVGFFLWYDEESVVNISIQEAMELGHDPRQYILEYDEQGNPSKLDQPRVYGGTDKPRTFSSLEITIEPYSMDRMSDATAARAAATLTSTMQGIMPLVLQNPQGRWDVYFAALSKYTRIPEIKHLINLEAAAQMAGSQLLAQYAEMLAASEGKPVSGASKNAGSKPANQGAPPGGGARVGGASQPPPQKPQTGAPGGMQGRSAGGVASQQAKSKGKAA